MILTGAVALQQIHEGAQLQSRDVGPASAPLHPLEEVEQGVAVGREAAAEGSVLKVAVQLFELPQQFQQGSRLPLQFEPELLKAGESCLQTLQLLGREFRTLLDGPDGRILASDAGQGIDGDRRGWLA